MMTTEKYIVGQPGGPSGPFYSVVSSSGRVITMQIPDEKDARFIAGVMGGMFPSEREMMPKLIDALLGMVGQHCAYKDKMLMDFGHADNANAIALLVELGYLEQVRPDKDWYRWVKTGD